MDDATPFLAIEPGNHAAWLVVVTITFLVYSALGVTSMVLSRLPRTSPRPASLKSYDWTVLAALVFAVAQSAFIVNACRDGLGEHQSKLSDIDLDRVRKQLFAASLLSVAVHMLAKFSTVLLVMAINERNGLHIACNVVFGLTAAWGVAAIFLLSFRCRDERPWDANNGRCLNNIETFAGINTVNILTDLALVVLPCIMISRLHQKPTIKLRVVCLFATRIVVSAMVVLQTVYYGRNSTLDDETWLLVEPLLLGQVALNASILTACVPSLKGIIDMFRSGASVFTMPGHYITSSRRGMTHGFRSKARAAETPEDMKRDEIQDRSESQEELRYDASMRNVDGEDEIQYR